MKQSEEAIPTYEEYTKDMSLVDQIKFYYDVDLKDFFPDGWMADPWEIVAQVAINPNWLNEFNKEFKEYLQEREYIQ
jgi:hypothetical protein|tara:strand:+ start:69 stop:299 length:231 start_codon:yes stop_codon:yes gene_type:complete